jgi:DNA-binding transcriptional ArsR family regulator
MSATVTAVVNGGSGSVRVAHPLPDDLVELIADRFRALAEPTRIKLLDRLREGEATVLELTALVGTTQQNVSKHLNTLQHAGIVARRKQGNFSYYRITDESIFALCQVVCGALQSRYDGLRRISEAVDAGSGT